jgi:hypothetical protein
MPYKRRFRAAYGTGREAPRTAATVSAVGSALIAGDLKIKRPGRVLLAPAPTFSTEDAAFDAAPNRSSYG